MSETQVTAKPRSLSLRISEIPADIDIEQLIDILEAFSPQESPQDSLEMGRKKRRVEKNIILSSYAPAATSADKGKKFVATVTFRDVPPALHGNIVLNGLERQFTVFIDSDFFGLTPLSNPQEITVDIIAVTGLAGHAFGSWKSRSAPTMWLRDFLPEYVPEARILTYGYDSSLIRSESSSSIYHFAGRFLETLKTVRAREDEKQRPIVFIGHSLGGLIIKQALVRAAQGSEKDKQIFMSCYALLFFGVPNRGLHIDTLKSMVKFQPNSKLVEDLDPASASLRLLHEAFSNHFKFDDSPIVSVFETKWTKTVVECETNVWKRIGPTVLMVPQDSATYSGPNEKRYDQISIDADHSDIVKFNNVIDSNYITIRERIMEYVGEAPAIIKRRFTPPTRSSSQQSPTDMTTKNIPRPLLPPLPTHIALATRNEDQPSGRPVPPITSNKNASLWIQAYRKLSEDDKIVLSFNNTDKTEIWKDLLKEINLRRDMCQQNRWKFNFRGKEIIIRDIADKTLVWVYKFINVGDTVAQYNPDHAALPWAGVRLLLQLCPGDKESMGAILIGVEMIARILARSSIQEEFYLTRKLTVSATICVGLENCIMELYSAVLEFLACAKRYLEQHNAARMLRTLLDLGGAKCLFDIIEERELSLDQELKIVEGEIKRQYRVMTKDQHEKLQVFLQEIEKPITRTDLNIELISKKLEGDKRRKILEWLSKIEYIKHHRKAQEDLLEDTGQWLLNKKQFCEWRSSSASEILWLHGIPGAGKTKLTCMVIDLLKGLEPVVYFYCNRNDPQRQDPELIMQAIVKQLSVALAASASLPALVVDEYDKREKEGFAAGPLGFQESQNLIVSLLDIYPQTTIIIDALDESDPKERWRLLAVFKSIIESSTSLVKIFVSSRNDIDITLKLEQVPNLYINAQDNTGDIERFVLREVKRSIDNHHLLNGIVPDELKEHIISSIIAKANGMFQWANLQITHLHKFEFLDEIEENLGRLPETLEKAYAQIWSDILQETPEQRRVTKRALMWVMCSQEPLNREKWAEVSYWPKQAPQGGVDILFKLCRNLVTWDKQLDRVIFAHLSIQEYFESSNSADVDPGRRAFNSVDANSMATESCLLLLGDRTQIPQIVDPTKLSYFAKYSIENWADHAELSYNCEQRMADYTRTLLLRFLGTLAKPSEAYSRWKQAAAELLLIQPSSYTRLKNAVKYLDSTPLNPWFAIFYFGFGEQIKEQWKSDSVDVNSRNNRGATLLLVASMQGNEWAMDFLLEQGADVNAGHSSGYKSPLIVAARGGHSSDFENPLMAAIRMDQKKAVFKLIDAGASISANRCRYKDVLEDVLEAAVYQRSMSIVETMSRDTNLQMTDAIVVAAVEDSWKGYKIMQLLLAKCPTIKITKAVLRALQRMYASGMVRLLAGNSNTEITEAAVITIIEGDVRMFLPLLASARTIEVTEAVLVAIVKTRLYHYGNNYEIMKLLLAKNPNTEITEAVVAAAARGWESGVDMMELLLDKNPSIEITEAVVAAAARNEYSGIKIIELLLAKNPSIEITEAVVAAAAGNYRGIKIMELLLAKNTNIEITKAVVAAAVGNSGCGVEIMKMLLAKNPNIEITEAAVAASARGSTCGLKVMMLLAKNPNIEITEAVVAAAVGNSYSDIKIIELLLAKNPNIEITEPVVAAAAGNGSGRIEVMAFLLAKNPNIEINEAVVTAAARNSGINIIEFLLAKNPSIEITEAVVAAAARNEYSGIKIIEFLLAKNPSIEITEAVVAAAAGNNYSGIKIIELLLDNTPSIKITEAVVTAAAGDSDIKIIELLLAKNPNIEITEAVLVAATGNYIHSIGIMELLLDKNPNIETTDAVVAAAVGSWNNGIGIMELLLAKSTSIKITSAVLAAGLGNNRSGIKIMELLLAKNPNIEITEAVVAAAAANRTSNIEIMAFLLTENPKTEITEIVLAAAASNRGGIETLELLLARDPSTEITEAVWIAAAGNQKNGNDAIKLLLANSPTIKITEAILTAAVENQESGKQIMQLLLDINPTLDITQAVMMAAENSKNKGVMKLLLARAPNMNTLPRSDIALADGDEASAG